MDARVYLNDYAKRADKYLARFFTKKINEVKDIGRGGKGVLMAVDMLSKYKRFIRGGKKLRGALIQLGYEIAGGKKRDVLPASTCIEIIHSFLLIHDDIMDLDSMRRGDASIHTQYEQQYRNLKLDKDAYHYGISMGINMGDLGAYLGMEVLLSSKLDAGRKLKAAIYLSRLLQRTAFGQGLDVTFEAMKDISEHDVMQVNLHKTSIYTIVGPLKIGALLGGLPARRVKAIEKFGEPIGKAFQLADDELGLFGDQGKLGKDIGQDIKVGKNTILRIKATEFAKGEDKKFLKYAYGNQSITAKDIKKVQDLTMKTGAFVYSQELSKKLAKKGNGYIPKITKDKEIQETLSTFANFVIQRDK